MIQVTQSPFLQALGYAIINSLWQFALLWLFYILIIGVGKMSSHKRFVTGLVLQVSGFTWFTLTLLFYYQQSQQLAASAVSMGGEYAHNIIRANSSGSGREKLFAYLVKTEQFLPYLSIAYLALLLVLSVKWIQAYKYTNRMRIDGISKIDIDWRLFVQRLAQQMGITRTIKIYLSDVISSPLTIGFLKPVILVPFASINHLTPHQLEAVLLHELAHIKRHDYLVNIMLSVIEAVLFFNPFMQLLSRNIKRERENCCDDWVLQYEYNATTYARALLKLATFNGATPAFAMHAAANKHMLLKRVKRIIERNERTFNYSHQLLALLLITGILSIIAWFSPIQNGSKIASKTANELSFNPLVARIENPLFNPVFLFADKTELNARIAEAEKFIRKPLVTIRTVPVVTVHANHDFRVEDIAPPVLNSNDFLMKRMIDTHPAVYFYYNDSTANGQVRRISTASFWRALESNGLKLQQAKGTIAKLKKESKATLMVMQQVESILDRAQQSHNKLIQFAEGIKTNNQLLQSEQLRAHTLKTIDVKKLNEQVNQQMEEVQKQVATAITWTSVPGDEAEDEANARYVTAAPLVEKPHSYSYEYSSKPKLKLLSNARTQATLFTQSRSRHGEAKECSCPNLVDEASEVDTIPASQLPGISIRIHKGKIIKIIKI